ncbi:DUF5686 and carboxypeptidase regulatory-like domain-containing protein [Cesiribacter sp. SM1]|uniref:DUF5686 and carboxypeptidase regulatory-like domain-containing protein n=1 Tax=Cesiribacter sp. SM1 TaxID=2861196 RepID=UPI001CD6C07F|nr:DUF5686 and carboxypeptidase regulatory-like domain-containing protein [Cesiribacter sp. SM1]
MKSLFSTLLVLLFFISGLYAQGIRGTVKTADGEPLPYASIYVMELKNGSSTNINGSYEIKLSPGTYNIRIQYLGYQMQQHQLEIGEDWLEQNFVLKEQVEVLNTVEIKRKEEDPALTIMRKAISKRKYHLLQYDSYQTKVYIKGTGQVTSVPFFLKKKLKEEGVLLDEAYTMESVSIVKFQQPDKIEERVISIRSSGENNGASPSPYINQSFYNDRIATAISPLSGAAFAYYKFRFEGSFREGDLEINKIRVIPRSKGEQVFDGYIYIIDDLWAIHSLDLTTSIQGFKVRAKQNYAEVAPKVWMPVTHQYKISGKALGFAGEVHYIASCSEYQVQLNQDLLAETEIIDEKIEEVPEDLEISKPSDKDDIVETLASEEQMTKKQFRKMINQYEKEALKEQKNPEVVSERKQEIDSLAYKRDAAYWAEIRPVPLTKKEIEGYRRDDSLAMVQQARLTGKDSANVIKKGRLRPQVILFGGKYELSPRTTLAIDPTIAQTYYNTVEGFNVNVSAKLIHRFDSLRKRIEFNPTLRYGFSSENFYGKGRLSYATNNEGKRNNFHLEGGSFVSQFNDEEPIHPLINTLYSLALRQNFMKVYEKNYARLGYQYSHLREFVVSASLEWAQRNELFDQSNYSFYKGDSRSYSYNRPQNIELQNTGFPEHEALIFNAELRYRPGLTYRMYNGKKYANLHKAPELILNYRKGISNVLGSDVDYDQLELGINHGYEFGVSGRLEFELRGGTFLNNRRMHFMDYEHFDGNRTILSTLRPAGGYRLLDYYDYSTNGSYFAGHTHYQFRKFLLTQLPMLRMSGLKENIFVNYLKTGSSPHYYELGYSIDNILRIFRVEAAASFRNGDFVEVAPRIGIATIFKINTD